MKTVDLDIDDCLVQVRRRDQDAARSLVEHLYPLVTSIVRRKLPRGVAEEDLVQDIFVRMFEKMNQYKGEVPLEHWVSRIAVNRCLNAIRSQRSRPEWRMADLPEDQQAMLEPGTMAMEQQHPARALASQELVDNILRTLSPEDSVIVRMLEIEDRSVAEVQRVTGRSARYIRVRAFRARQQLHKRFGRLKQDRQLLLSE